MIEKVSIRGSRSYRDVLDIQAAEFDRRVECRKNGVSLPGDVVFFVEHRPVYTIGRHGDATHLLLSKETLEEKGIEFASVGRGGDITYHGPGQITVYPIIDLLRYGLGVKDYVHLLEQCVMDTLSSYGVTGERIVGRTGVWIGKGTTCERKICAIGIKCSRHVSMHGFALNVGSDISLFTGIVPCGLTQGVTSLSLEVGREIEIDEVEQRLWLSLTSLLLPRIHAQGNS